MRLDVKNVAHGLLFCVFLCKMNRPMAGWGASQPQFPVDLSAERASRPSLAWPGLELAQLGLDQPEFCCNKTIK